MFCKRLTMWKRQYISKGGDLLWFKTLYLAWLSTSCHCSRCRGWWVWGSCSLVINYFCSLFKAQSFSDQKPLLWPKPSKRWRGVCNIIFWICLICKTLLLLLFLCLWYSVYQMGESLQCTTNIFLTVIFYLLSFLICQSCFCIGSNFLITIGHWMPWQILLVTLFSLLNGPLLRVLVPY